VLKDSRDQGRGLLAIGNPDFDSVQPFARLRPEPEASQAALEEPTSEVAYFRGSRSACGEFKSLRFLPLPASSPEVELIARLWKDRDTSLKQAEGPTPGEQDDTAEASVVSLTGGSATEDALKRGMRGRQVLHLATHAFFLGECPSALSSRGGGPDLPDNLVFLAGENPLLLSGLALAGANRRQAAKPDEEDGILTAEEIAAQDLRGVSWVVLSACDTGVGRVVPGEGVLGLRRAFRIAGARTVITSLWPIEDEAARDWMRRLYESRLSGRSTIEAVHEASLGMLKARRGSGRSTHPFFWGAFVATGDWR
jgi:CHAT domain-containing protein